MSMTTSEKPFTKAQLATLPEISDGGESNRSDKKIHSQMMSRNDVGITLPSIDSNIINSSSDLKT